MTSTEFFQLRIIDIDANELDADDCIYTGEELDRDLADWNAAPVVCGGFHNKRIDAYEIDMADGSRGFVRVIGIAQ